MISVQKVIFPGIFLGCLFLVLVTSMIANPKVAEASYRSPAAVANVPTKAVSAEKAAGEVSVSKADASVVDKLATSGAKQAKKEQAVDQPAAEEQPPAKQELKKKEQTSAEAENCLISSSFPDSIQQWCDLISRYASEHNLEPNLIAALILQESGGNAQAYSRNGAVGLMQVMPRDGLAAGFMCINGPCFGSRPSTDELYDPEFNVSYGTRMLAGLIQKKGDVREALYSYGPSNMGYRYADIVLSLMQRYQ